MTKREHINSPAPSTPAKLLTGISGLDYVLAGGLPANRLYLVQGDPGVGKTTLGLQFLLEGVKHGESGLYVTLSETAEELKAVAQSHRWSLDGLALHELASIDATIDKDVPNTLFHPSEVELQETMEDILRIVEKIKPRRVVFDSLSELRLLAQGSLRYRRQILWLKQFFVGKNCTVLMLDDRTSEQQDNHLQSLAHGVVILEQLSPLYGAERRRLRVLKLRGVNFHGGFHDFNITSGGLRVFPRLVAADHPETFRQEMVASGITEIDHLLGGGLHRGTSTLLIGPAGTGKSIIATQYAVAAAARGEKSALYIFDESMVTLFARTESLGFELKRYVNEGMITVQQIDPAELPPGQFVQEVRDAVETQKARVIVIDSLNGYLNSMPDEPFLNVQLHELLSYLRQHGIVTILVVSQSGIMGSSMQTPVDISYLADTVILLRYFEATGEIRKAISVLKKRSGQHETTIRELRMGPKGLRVGEPLKEFHGIMTGVPTYDGAEHPLLSAK